MIEPGWICSHRQPLCSFNRLDREDLLFRGQSVRSYRSYHLAGLPGDDGLSEVGGLRDVEGPSRSFGSSCRHPFDAEFAIFFGQPLQAITGLRIDHQDVSKSDLTDCSSQTITLSTPC